MAALLLGHTTCLSHIRLPPFFSQTSFSLDFQSLWIATLWSHYNLDSSCRLTDSLVPFLRLEPGIIFRTAQLSDHQPWRPPPRQRRIPNTLRSKNDSEVYVGHCLTLQRLSLPDRHHVLGPLAHRHDEHHLAPRHVHADLRRGPSRPRYARVSPQRQARPADAHHAPRDLIGGSLAVEEPQLGGGFVT